MELHREADKFFTEIRHLKSILEKLEREPNEVTASLALSQAKRVRRSSNMIVRAIARIRETATAEEA